MVGARNPPCYKVLNTGPAPGVVRSGHPYRQGNCVQCARCRLVSSIVYTPYVCHTTPSVARRDHPPEADDSSLAQKGAALSDVNMGHLREAQKEWLLHTLRPQNVVGLFPEDPKQVRACTVRALRISLIDENAPPIAAKQQRFSPEQADAIQREVGLSAKRNIIRKSSSAWAARCVTVPKNDGTLRLCQDNRALNNRMKTDSGELGDMQGICERCQGCSWFTSIDLASGFFQLPVAEKDRHKPLSETRLVSFGNA